MKSIKIKDLIWYAGAIIVVILVVLYVRHDKQQSIMEAIYKVAPEQFTEYVDFVSYHGLDVTLSYEFLDYNYNRIEKSIDAVYTAKITSSVISNYRDIEYNSDKAKELCDLLKKSYTFHLQESTGIYNVGDKEITIIIDTSLPASDGMIVYDQEGNSYEYLTTSKPFECVKINGEYIYWKDNSEKKSTSSSSSSSSKPSSSSSSSSNEYTGKYDATLKYGSGKVLICISEEAMDRYFTALNKGYEGTIDELESTGQIGWTAKGTKCNIIDFGISRCKVKLLDGIYAGNTVWVITESVEKK